MKKSVFITGGAGFVGASVTQYFVQRGWDVHVAVRSGGDVWRIRHLLSKITLYTGILKDEKQLEKLFQNTHPYAIIHLAAFGAYPSQDEWAKMIEVNINTLKRLLDASVDIPYKRFIVAGSSSEYGYRDTAMMENDRIMPNSLYAVTKASATHLCQYYATRHKKPITVLRFFNIYGPFEEEGRLVRSVIESALQNNPIKLATGREARDFIHTDDIVRAIVKTISAGSRADGEVFNLGTGKETTIYELAKKVVCKAGSQSKIVKNAYPGRAWDAYHWKASTEKSEKVLGWKAKILLEEGLKKTIEWYRQELRIMN